MNSPAASVSAHARPPAVAGTFYPRGGEELRRMVEQFIEEGADTAQGPFKAFVLPHAGYIYSGPVAGTGYHLLSRDRETVRRIILLGPSHWVAFRGLGFSGHEAFATPLGVVPVDRQAIEALRDLPQVVEMDSAHEREHSLEVHLPFLQVALRDFTVVPLVVGDAEEAEVAAVLARLWDGNDTRVIVSSDLSHYHDYQTACLLDRKTAHYIEALTSVTPAQACGAIPLDGLLVEVRRRGMQMQTLDLRNSGDTAGPWDRVVGYGAFAAH